MSNNGTQFETLTHKVFELLSANDSYSEVKHDVMLDSPDGPRQFDVVIRSKVSSLDLLTVIECRDYKKNLSVTHVDGLHSKQLDVKANKAVLVARKGFSNGAKRKAKRLGITLCTVRELDGLKTIGLEVPIIVREITGVNLRPTGIIQSRDKSISLKPDAFQVINDVPLIDKFREAVISGEITPETSSQNIMWRPKFSGENAYIRDKYGEKVELKIFTVYLSIQSRIFFGYVDDLEGTIGIKNFSQDETSLFFKAEDIFNYRERFQKYDSLEDVPHVNAIGIYSVSIPIMSRQGSTKIIAKKL